VDNDQLKTINNEEKNRFELTVDGHLGRIEYIINKTGMIFLTHTEVARELEGKGIASKMVKDALQYIQERELKLVPLCPYVAAYLKKHPEYQPLLAKGYHI
jgi:predicted GNAT family acetyltransferase